MLKLRGTKTEYLKIKENVYGFEGNRKQGG